jgi:hypothetical protein
MKKYFISILIPCLLIYLTGCYSMEIVSKEELIQTSDKPKLLVKTNEKEITFNQGDYLVKNDTIYGQGDCRTINSIEEPFDSSLGLADVNEIQMEEFKTGETIALASIVIVVIAGFLALAAYSTWSLDNSWGK